jgi:hypothetical protein
MNGVGDATEGQMTLVRPELDLPIVHFAPLPDPCEFRMSRQPHCQDAPHDGEKV